MSTNAKEVYIVCEAQNTKYVLSQLGQIFREKLNVSAVFHQEEVELLVYLTKPILIKGGGYTSDNVYIEGLSSKICEAFGERAIVRCTGVHIDEIPNLIFI